MTTKKNNNNNAPPPAAGILEKTAAAVFGPRKKPGQAPRRSNLRRAPPWLPGCGVRAQRLQPQPGAHPGRRVQAAHGALGEGKGAVPREAGTSRVLKEAPSTWGNGQGPLTGSPGRGLRAGRLGLEAPRAAPHPGRSGPRGRAPRVPRAPVSGERRRVARGGTAGPARSPGSPRALPGGGARLPAWTARDSGARAALSTPRRTQRSWGERAPSARYRVAPAGEATGDTGRQLPPLLPCSPRPRPGCEFLSLGQKSTNKQFSVFPKLGSRGVGRKDGGGGETGSNPLCVCFFLFYFKKLYILCHNHFSLRPQTSNLAWRNKISRSSLKRSHSGELSCEI